MKILLVMRTADGRERPFPLREKTIIGREVRSDIRLAIPTVEDRHCELTLDKGHIWLSDLGTKNGTFHNGRRVERAPLRHADRVTVGPITFEVRMQQAVELENHRSMTAASQINLQAGGNSAAVGAA